MFNLFALTDDPANRRLRFSLSNEVQSDLTEFITQQESEFHGNEKEEIQFDGKYKPDPGEVLVISEFDDIDGLADAVAFRRFQYGTSKPSRQSSIFHLILWLKMELRKLSFQTRKRL